MIIMIIILATNTPLHSWFPNSVDKNQSREICYNRTTTDVLHQTEELWQVLRLAYNVWSCIKRKSSENAYNAMRDVCDA